MIKKYLLLTFLLFVSGGQFLRADIINVWQTIDMLSVNNAGVQGNNFSSPAFQVNSFVTSDNRYVVFASDATNLVSGDSNGGRDVFLRDRQLNTIELISVTSTGIQGNGNDSSFQMMSDDGRYVVFQSDATNFYSGDTNNAVDIFVKDRQTGLLETISINSSGNVGNAISRTPGITLDGRYVVFQSDATNLISGAIDGRSHIYLKDRQLNTLEIINRNDSGTLSNHTTSNIRGFSMTPDGRYVVFHSNATNIASGTSASWNQIYLRDRQLGTTVLLSRNNSGTVGNGSSSSPVISRDGRYVVFSGRPTNFFSGASASIFQIYLRDIQAGTTELISNSLTGGFGNLNSIQTSHISSSGRYVLFHSLSTNLVTGDTNNAGDLFMKDRFLNTTQRVSVTYTGGELNSGSQLAQVSHDGKYVFYGSDASNVVPGDFNATLDVFVSEYKTIEITAPTIINPVSGTQVAINNQIVSGTGFSGYRLDLYDMSTSSFLRSGVIDSGGNWSTNLSFVASGAYTIGATQTYITGSFSTGISLTSFILYVPIPTISSPISGSLFNTSSLVVQGTGIAGAIISLNISGVSYTGIIDSGGNWNIILTGLQDQYYTIDVVQTFSGSTSLPIITFFTIDTTLPVAPVPSGGGGGGGGGLVMDKCPVGEDYSPSYYDRTCGTKPVTTTTGGIVPTTTTGSTVQNAGSSLPTVKPTLPTGESNSATIPEAQQQAYKWTLSQGITTAPSLEAAKLDTKITRAQLAKMVSVYATTVLDKQPVSNKRKCVFKDERRANADLVAYMRQACQLQIMGIESDGETPLVNFQPNSYVTRAEFGTVLSRILYGQTYNKIGDKRRTDHLNNLKTNNIITVIDPTLVELRGWIMVMLYRTQ